MQLIDAHTEKGEGDVKRWEWRQISLVRVYDDDEKIDKTRNNEYANQNIELNWIESASYIMENI